MLRPTTYTEPERPIMSATSSRRSADAGRLCRPRQPDERTNRLRPESASESPRGALTSPTTTTSEKRRATTGEGRPPQARVMRAEDISDPLMQKIRYLDKLIDELP